MSKIYQGIVLKVVPYKESDAIITLLTKDEGYISFKARGVFKINSKNASSLQLYTIGEYKVESKLEYSNKTLLSGSIIYFPLKIYDDLSFSSLLAFINEIISTYRENYLEGYEIIEKIIKNLDKINVLTTMLLLLKYLLKWNGVLFEVDKCVKCGCQKINVFSYKDGGFLCRKCETNNYIDNLNYLKQMRIVIKAEIGNLLSYEVDNLIGYRIANDLLRYIENNLGIYLKSKEMLLLSINTDSRLT